MPRQETWSLMSSQQDPHTHRETRSGRSKAQATLGQDRYLPVRVGRGQHELEFHHARAIRQLPVLQAVQLVGDIAPSHVHLPGRKHRERCSEKMLKLSVQRFTESHLLMAWNVAGQLRKTHTQHLEHSWVSCFSKEPERKYFRLCGTSLSGSCSVLQSEPRHVDNRQMSRRGCAPIKLD